MDTAVKMPVSRRINLRIVVFAGIIVFLLGTPMYIFIREAYTGGAYQEGDVIRVDLKALGNFQFDQVEGTINDVPEQWRKLDGKKVALDGEMYVTNTSGDKLKDFQLVYNIQKCCFNGPPKVQERVFAYAPEGKTVDYYPGLARVEGVLHVNPVKENGQVVSLYTMEVASAQQK
jgi:hypothetical protein